MESMDRKAVPIETIDPDVRAMWTACVQANYHDEATDDCKYCKTHGKACRRFFCVTCREGGLCHRAFRVEGYRHYQHDILQIYKTSGAYSVRQPDVQRNSIRRSDIAEFISNSIVTHYLRKRNSSTAYPRMFCHGCKEFVPNAKTDIHMKNNENSAKVCSMECLLTYTAQPTTVLSYRNHNRNRRKQLHPQRSPLQ